MAGLSVAEPMGQGLRYWHWGHEREGGMGVSTLCREGTWPGTGAETAVKVELAAPRDPVCWLFGARSCPPPPPLPSR
jgi:hypothetical protein